MLFPNLGRQVSQFGDHRHYRLGQWYQHAGKDRFGHLESCKQMDKPHSIVHDNIIESMKCLEGEDKCVENHDMILADFKAMNCLHSPKKCSKEEGINDEKSGHLIGQYG